MRKILSVFLLMIFVIFITSCNQDDQFKSVVSGDFIYSKIGVPYPDKNVAIIGLSDEGETKETIVFPTTIDGYRVSKIGTQDIKRPSGPIIFSQAKKYLLSINKF